jgi:hypothetical protein
VSLPRQTLYAKNDDIQEVLTIITGQKNQEREQII